MSSSVCLSCSHSGAEMARSLASESPFIQLGTTWTLQYVELNDLQVSRAWTLQNRALNVLAGWEVFRGRLHNELLDCGCLAVVGIREGRGLRIAGKCDL